MEGRPQPERGFASAEVIAHVERSGFVESVHHGVVAVVDRTGAVLLERGDVTAPIFPRSSNKPMQTAAMVRLGLDLPAELLALTSASHSGEAYHLDGAQRILDLAGLGAADLQNTPDLPYDESERRRWIAAGRAPEAIAQNCSGKHAAMLLTCVVNGWSTHDYRDAGHPLQQAIADTLAELAGEPVAATGIDGCGAPVLAISTAGVARAFSALAVADPDTAQGRVADAIRRYPRWLGGTTRDVSTLIEGVPGLIAKDGAEAVYAIGLADGTGIAVKIADGGQRARPVVAAAVLRGLDLPEGPGVVAALDALATAPVRGHGEPVGAVRAVGF